MSTKEKINWYPFVELPDYKVRYLIRDSEKNPIAVLRFEEDGTPHLRYLKAVPSDLEIPILNFVNDSKKLLFGN